MNATIQDAYREACLALGEETVVRRLQAAELVRLEEQVEPPAPPSGLPDDVEAGVGLEEQVESVAPTPPAVSL